MKDIPFFFLNALLLCAKSWSENQTLKYRFSLIFIVISYGALVSANPVTFVNGSDVNVVENIGGPVLIVEALASQPPGDAIVSISLLPQEDHASFALVDLEMPSPGVGLSARATLSFAGDFDVDFEAPSDLGGTPGDNVYVVIFRATDSNGDFADQTLRVSVQDANETPVAVDDSFIEFPELIVDEDSGELIFDVTGNDLVGDSPTQVIAVGETITDSFGVVQSWRSTTRLADASNTGDAVLVANGEVSCANEAGCQEGETADTSIDASSILPNQIMYKPRSNFFGEDSFIYCIEDSNLFGEPAFERNANDSRCATVTVMVNPVNDLPIVSSDIIYTVDQGGQLNVSVEDGLSQFAATVDYTHIDGQGCDPADSECTPSENIEELFFFFQSATTQNGSLVPPFATDGSFNYRPSPAFVGSDNFLVDVCESETPSADGCVFDVSVTIVVNPVAGAPDGLSDQIVELDFDLADVPLELPVGPEANVLIVNDDSGSMNWDILTDQANGVYFFSTGNFIFFTMKATAGFSLLVAPSEEASPDQGLWRLRNPQFNATYYNPAVRYAPWDGLNPNNVDFPPSPPNEALHNPMSPSGSSTNLRINQSYDGASIVQNCRRVCVLRRFGRCLIFRNICSNQFSVVRTTNFYLPRYYRWEDRNTDGQINSTPSPFLDPENSEGKLVEIRPASEGGGFPVQGSGFYPKSPGRTDCSTNSSFCTYDEELQNFANWFTYARNREFTFKSALGKVVSASQNLRVGYAKINSSVNRKPIVSMNTSERTGAKADLLDAIYLTTSNGGTPLRRALRRAGSHFECAPNDSFGSDSFGNPGDAGCPIEAAPAGNCQQNFTLLLTDGAWNGPSPYPGSPDQDDDNNTNFDGGVYAGSFNESLADVAMDYYERDLHPELPNEVATSGRDIAGAALNAFEQADNKLMHQHMKTFTVGFGVNGLVEDEDVPVDFTQPFNWGNPTTSERKIDDVRHAAVNGRGQYLSAGDASSLAESLITAFEEFQQGTGAASAVSFNSNEILEGTLVFRSFYNTKNNTGDLIAQSIDESGVVTEEEVWSAASRLDRLDADNRQIITLDRDKESSTFGQGIPFRGGALNASQRSRFISNMSASVAEQDLQVSRSINYLRGSRSLERPNGNFRERPAEKGRLGDIVHSAPAFIGRPSRLGRDALPFPQDEGKLYSDFKTANESRLSVVYVGANDGMVHGFNAETGDEVIAYVPDNLMTNVYSSSITELLNFEYAHKYFVDSSPAVNDVYIDSDGDRNKEWRTILVNGQGKGGKAYVALDITNPASFSEARADQIALWEFTDRDDTYPTDSSGLPLLFNGEQRQDLLTPAQPVKDLGYSFSVPTLAMSNLKDSDNQHKWIALFGNGYNSTAGIAKLFVLLIDGGVDGVWCHPDMRHTPVPNGFIPPECIGEQDFFKLDTGFGVQDGLPNGLGEPRAIDIDGNQTADYVYAGDIQGNLFRFDIRSDDHKEWVVEKIFESSYRSGSADEKKQPITTQPIVIAHPSGSGFIVIFASGSYIRASDSTNKDIQSIYGIWDRLSPGLVSKADLQEQEFINVLSDNGRVRILSDNPVDYSFAGGQRGWFIDLDAPPAGFPRGSVPEFPGERAVRNIQLKSGLGFVNSVFPQNEGSCIEGAGGSILAFCPETGGSSCFNNRAIFDLNNDGTFDDNLAGGEVIAGIIIENSAPPTDSAFIGDKRVTQTGSDLSVISTNTFSGENTGRLSWKRLEN